ncbi:MAG: pentapeptide repeat-containing protein [Acidimicrobiia bacterium]|nr:MAG: pentapeptide repeat-containing protein [Acidimicrobiia bacterium]
MTYPDPATCDDRIYAFRSVHPDGRSSLGFRWPLTPGAVVEADGPFTDRPDDGCPAREGDGICLAHTAAGMASGRIPAITVLVCSYDPADLLGTEPDGSKVRVKRCRVESVHDLPGVLRGADGAEGHDCLPTPANLSRADLSRADLYGADLSRAKLSGAIVDRATTWPAGFDPIAAGVRVAR